MSCWPACLLQCVNMQSRAAMWSFPIVNWQHTQLFKPANQSPTVMVISMHACTTSHSDFKQYHRYARPSGGAWVHRSFIMLIWYHQKPRKPAMQACTSEVWPQCVGDRWQAMKGGLEGCLQCFSLQAQQSVPGMTCYPEFSKCPARGPRCASSCVCWCAAYAYM